MNIVMLMAGGVGRRFGSMIPKQYNLLCGQPVIDYVIDAIKKSKSTDKVVVVIDEQWIEYSDKLKKSGFDFAPNGDTRLQSVQSGLEFIHRNYACDRLLIVDSVAPFLYADLIDQYFSMLDDYSAVITAQKITGGFTNVCNEPLDREEFIITQSPEAFRFEEFYRVFDVNYPYQEMACMLPASAKRYYNFNFPFNLKLTYDYDLKYAEYILHSLGRELTDLSPAFFDKRILYTAGLKDYLLRCCQKQTEQWLEEVYQLLPRLIARWEITSFLPNQMSRYGLVIDAKSQKYGDVIIKLIPGFINRFQREMEAVKLLSGSFMAQLRDCSPEDNAMLLAKVPQARYASFDENLKLIDFFDRVTQNALPYSESLDIRYAPHYIDELKEKLAAIDTVPFLKGPIRRMLEEAVDMYRQFFEGEPLYYIHGDLHCFNILDDGDRFCGIDPNGMIAPLAFEYVRFIRNDIKAHPKFGFLSRLEMLLQSFARFCRKEAIVRALVIDLAFTTFNSTFENETEEDAVLNMKVADAAYEWLEANRLELP